ncbi:hypothetical protein [Clostridium sp. DL1XJH146]
MKYQLVALFDEQSNEFLNTVQRDLCKKYKVYKIKNNFCLPVKSLSNPDVEKLTKILEETISPYKKFKIQISKDFCLNNNSKVVSIIVNDSGYIKKISRKLDQVLCSNGFNVYKENETPNISLATSNYNIRKELYNKPNKLLNYNTKWEEFLAFARINRLELRRISNNKKQVVIQTFNLRSY